MAIWASGAAATVSPMRRNSNDPAKITQEKTLAHHQARPECTTSIPKAIPMGMMASPTEPEIFSAAKASDRGGIAGAAEVDFILATLVRIWRNMVSKYGCRKSR